MEYLCVFRAYWSVFFNIFPRLDSIIGWGEGAPKYFLRFLWIMLQYSIQALYKI